MRVPPEFIRFYALASSSLFATQNTVSLGHERQVTYNEQPRVELRDLEHWGHYAAATYQNFETWDDCNVCQEPDIQNSSIAATWSTVIPAYSRGFVAVHHGRQQVVVAFRGSTHVMDALTDIQTLQTAWPPNVDGSRVHSGFLRAYNAASSLIEKTLDGVADLGYELVFVGHSLGAAQATLAYVDWQSRSWKGGSKLVALGAPRVGNIWFARRLNDLGGRSGKVLRVVHESDVVVHLPRSIYSGQYVHNDRELWLCDRDGNEEMELIVCPLSEDEDSKRDHSCSAGISPVRWNIQDHLVYPGMQFGIPSFD
ncbi:hypothetical protein GGI07_000386 [Coemansia sp. Benny D115]|nr:hypothetical protein GGI07_000386 [Coemansia sp. Benny D115]